MRAELIERTFEALRARSAPSCTSTTRLRRCSATSSSGPIEGRSSTSPSTRAKQSRRFRSAARHESRFEYSPESFTATELDFALEICEAVMDVMEPTRETRSSSTCRPPSSGDAERLRRPDRMVRAAHIRPRRASSSPCTRITTAAPASPRRNSG